MSRLLWLIAVPIALIGWCLATAPAGASPSSLDEPATPSAAPVRPVLILDPVPETVLGGRPVVIAHLTMPDGQPIVGATLALSIEETTVDRAPTTDNGSVVLRIRAELAAGTYVVRVSFAGEAIAGQLPASTTGQVVIAPGTVGVQLVPAIVGLPVTLTRIPAPGEDPEAGAASITVASDASGAVHLPVNETGSYRLALGLPWQSPDPGLKAEFSRWMDNVFTPSRDLEYRPDLTLQAGFEMHYLVSYRFTNPQGDPVDASEVSAITFRNSMGERITRTDANPFWVKGGRVTRRTGGLEETRLLYSVDEVIVDGANVVNRSQHRFVPADERQWTVPLLYFAMAFASQDALFAFPAGTAVEVVSPNGTVHHATLDAAGTVSIPLLPRGEYKVRVLGGGYSPAVPVSLSRDQAVSLRVISAIDVAAVGGLGAGVALGLLLMGRWRSALRILRRHAPLREKGATP